ncbi:MAG: hypothetical protein FJZ00_05505 [Candidatus Sericytochromatia bacterium]|uniref:N-acetyltransferase n=1 Tax=Candidatus Tanganyikabacteria bacterium TaxID=2961651 RepID=A0A937X275_9BACT|nr:hypothetical protein [Candidatus Tanganyikabacteria bacterium]
MYQVVGFDREPARVADFLALPWRLYRDDPRWIPPFRASAEAAATNMHPLGNLLIQRNFLLLRQGAIVARASAVCNPAVQVDGGPLGSVGNFEADDDPDAARSIVEACFEWLHERGCKTAWGPMNGSMWLPYRFMTVGFDDMPFYGEPYNKPYYPELFAYAGFTPLKKWTSVFTEGEAIASMVEKTRPRYEAALECGYRFRQVDYRRFEADLLELRRLISDSFAGFAGFHPIDEQTFLALYGDMKAIALPELVQFLLRPDGEIVGYLCMLPDYPRAIRAMRGKTDLLAKLRFLLARGRPTAYIALYLGITAAEQARRSGAGGALAYKGCYLGHRDSAVLVSALMAEGSYARAWSRGQQATVHEYALYQKVL